jgi:hypothetical protein
MIHGGRIKYIGTVDCAVSLVLRVVVGCKGCIDVANMPNPFPIALQVLCAGCRVGDVYAIVGGSKISLDSTQRVVT